MRVLALDLGTKTLGLAISDRTNTLASPLTTLRYSDENYELLLNELDKIISEYNVDTLVLGLPKNMDNSLGFASQRSLNFKKLLDDRFNLNIVLVDERLSTVEAENILINSDMRREKRKKIIDSAAAMIILENYLGSVKNEKE
ncbi:MAG: Holliday junction resolvase RuvX [Bacilli bacterium]|nr:Holliday junction resolvase RuvX [Bacilli bacterium]